MSFIIAILTILMVFTCLLLILLVLIQLPKKEAGAGLAFGGGATDALFGAGSGNVLTKATKYAIGAAFLLWIVLGALQSHFYHRGVTGLKENYEQQQQQESAPAPLSGAPVPASPATAPAAAPGASNAFSLPLNVPASQPAAGTSNAPASATSK